ncbi:nucleosome assembly protein 1-like 3 [Bradysia coprophila]|uniref:nucleosome assembly protein 1-like 3 n=1 Tax=Bradysia coprophila TaxID=38358 RepID=UPI00187DB5A3|nr:nucleosome assembly protein 1-like 3 [Bradysia coprophila]
MTDTQIINDAIEQTLSVTPIDPNDGDLDYSIKNKFIVEKVMQRNSHLQMLSRLSPEVRKRLRALRKLQLQTNAVEMEFSEKEFELEKAFHEKHQQILNKRFDIVCGKYEPNDDECDLPDSELLQRIDENISMITQLSIDGQPEGSENPIKGIPNFWLHILYSNPMLDFVIHDGDDDILKHLIDIRAIYQSQPHFAFILEFEFSANPYFENNILTKEYLLKMKFDDLLLYEGPEIFKTVGCEIQWKGNQKPVQPSFLDFFDPPTLPADVMDPTYDEIKNVLENDFEIGNYIKDHIIPKATLYYTGEFHDGCNLGCDSDSADGEDTDDDGVNVINI